MSEHPGREEAEETYSGDQLCLDTWSGWKFRASEAIVCQSIEIFKWHYQNNDAEISMDYLYDLLNLTRDPDGYRNGYHSMPRAKKKRIQMYTEWDRSRTKFKEDVLLIKYKPGSEPDELLPFE